MGLFSSPGATAGQVKTRPLSNDGCINILGAAGVRPSSAVITTRITHSNYGNGSSRNEPRISYHFLSDI